MKRKSPAGCRLPVRGFFIGKISETYFAGNRNGTAIQPDKMFHVKQWMKVPIKSEKLPVRIPGKVFCQKSSAGDGFGLLFL